MQLPKCDKCGGIEFEEEPEEIEYIPASEYFRNRQGYNGTTTATTYYLKDMVCKKCGAKYPQGQFSYTVSNVGSLDKVY